MGSLLSAGGKSRSGSGLKGGALSLINKRLGTGGEAGLNQDLISQMTEALRTGGIGAGLPIVAQSVGAANQATSSALRDTTAGLASSGLARTPFGQQTLASTRLQGAQAAAKIPTDYAQSFISQAPQFSQGLLASILSSIQHQSSRSGPYNV